MGGWTWLLVASMAAFAAPCEAQSPTITCRDVNGRDVAGVQVANGTIARATIDRGGPAVIEYDPRKIPGISPQQQLFVYAHECGHLALDHLRGGASPTAAQEHDADCYAIHALMDKAGFTANDAAILQRDMRQVDASEARHFPWPARAYNLVSCLASESTETANGGGTPKPTVDDCVLHRDEDDEIVNESRDGLSIDGRYAVANHCARDVSCTFTIQTGTMPGDDFDQEIWSRFHVQKTRTEQHDMKASAEMTFPFHENIETVPAGEAVNFRVLKACR